jgi:hypothetical protein
MKAVLKFILTSAGLVLILIGVAGLLLYSRAAELGVARMEKAVADAFSTPVAIERVSISPLNASVEVHGFSAGNPKGYKEGPAIECERIHIEFDPPSLVSGRPVVRRMRLDGTDIYYRHELGEGTNIGTLARLAAERAESGLRPKVVVRELVCENAEVHFSTNLVPLTRVGVDLVTVKLENVGAGEPVSAPKLTSIFLRSVTKEVLTLNGLTTRLLEPLKREAADLGERLGLSAP